MDPSPHRDAALDTVEHDLFNVTPAPIRDNLTTRERHALKRLSRLNDFVIMSADKGSGTVVMDRNWYIDECLRQLTDSKFYKTLDKDITTDIQKRVQIYVQRMHRDQIIDDHSKRFLLQTDPKPGRFYVLPKIYTVCRLSPQTSGTNYSILHKRHYTLPTNSNNSDNYPTTPFLSLWTSLLSTLTYLITKALTRVDTSSAHVTAPLLP